MYSFIFSGTEDLFIAFLKACEELLPNTIKQYYNEGTEGKWSISISNDPDSILKVGILVGKFYSMDAAVNLNVEAAVYLKKNTKATPKQIAEVVLILSK